MRIAVCLAFTLSVASVLAEQELLAATPSYNATTSFTTGSLNAASSDGDTIYAASSPSALTGGLWGLSAPLETARQDFKAVLLSGGLLGGEVLAIGGCCGQKGSLSGSELFNPSTNSWRRTGDLQKDRWLFQAVPLWNGSALAVGGLGIASGGVLNASEIFVPTSNGSAPFGEWRPAAGMQSPRQDFELVVLNDGRIMALGGFMASTEIYDPTQDAWTQSASMGDARSSFQALVLAGGKVLAVGGRGREGGPLATSELFDPANDSWSRQGDMHQGRAYFAAAELADGRVIAAGGKGASGQNLNSTEVYDPKTGEWTALADMNYQRSDLQAVTLRSGQILMVGGLGGRSSAESDILDSAEVYEPSTGKWTLTSPMVDARYVFQLVTLANSSVMALGGTGSTGYTASAEIFNSS